MAPNDQSGQKGTAMAEYEAFKAEFLASADRGEFRVSRNVIDLLKRNACLVDIIHGAKGLAEDIFANALEIEETYEPKH